MAKVRGWIGGHETAQDFHELVRADVRMACHMTANGTATEAPDDKQHHCAGYALYMNKMCKRSKDPEMGEFQTRMRSVSDEGLLFSWDGSTIADYHDWNK